ncbi:MAG: hypothetical protein K8L99_03180 [Anaerolineae bacterium]|nr:hypothetical protein [Anaerolineae bacterium]
MIRIVQRIVELPRLVRIVLVALLALMVTLALSPMVDELYFRLLFDSLAVVSVWLARVLPSLVTASIGLVMYAVGWWLVVGTVGETPAPRLVVLWYFGVGLLALVVVVFLLIRGVSLVNLINS